MKVSTKFKTIVKWTILGIVAIGIIVSIIFGGVIDLTAMTI